MHSRLTRYDQKSIDEDSISIQLDIVTSHWYLLDRAVSNSGAIPLLVKRLPQISKEIHTTLVVN